MREPLGRQATPAGEAAESFPPKATLKTRPGVARDNAQVGTLSETYILSIGQFPNRYAAGPTSKAWVANTVMPAGEQPASSRALTAFSIVPPVLIMSFSKDEVPI